ncbi:MAG: hypothetical protein JSR91_21130 [Proteobacteria bacterium]|nr:hypothetical protein [Pseudomonadota bacterium]
MRDRKHLPMIVWRNSVLERTRGDAGRHQFLAEFLEGQQIPALEGVKIPAVKGRFGPHTFYSFAISARRLLKIAFVNHQALDHPGARPAYQRMINKGRIKKIGQFIEKGGFFPTNLLVNFADKCRFDPLSNEGSGDDNLKFGCSLGTIKFACGMPSPVQQSVARSCLLPMPIILACEHYTETLVWWKPFRARAFWRQGQTTAYKRVNWL